MADNDYHGSMTMADGSRVALSADEAKSLWDSIEKATAERAVRLPDAHACLAAMSSASSRMKELGWRESTYCPRDGSLFAVCEIGSTGMWTANFSGEYIIYADCVKKPGRHMFFKPLDMLDEGEKARVFNGDKEAAAWVDRIGKAFGDQS